jgi:hypothetical protein
MSRKNVSKSSKRAVPPNFQQHDLPEPYARLLTLGSEEFPEVYAEVAAQLKEADPQAGAAKLLEMALDETYYEYWDEDFSDEENARSYTRVHAVRTLERMGEAANIAIEPLLPLMDIEDDWLSEEMPTFYAAMGKPAIEPLVRVLTDISQPEFIRSGAANSLGEIGEKPELRDEVIPLLEQALIAEKDNPFVAAEVVGALLDVGAKESLPIIQQAFEQGRVDETFVQMIDVEEHFGLPLTSPRKFWADTDRERLVYPKDGKMPGVHAGIEAEAAEERNRDPQTPYVATVKAGRNDPCPCGSGKKYKRCCGA